MSYQDELQAKLDAVRALQTVEHAKKLDTQTLEQQLLDELQKEFELSQYDLDESDILRSIKILHILNSYEEIFSQKNSLRVFYALAKAEVLQTKSLYALSDLPLKDFKHLINTMAKHRLLNVNADKELELSMDGQSLAERIGLNVFI